MLFQAFLKAEQLQIFRRFLYRNARKTFNWKDEGIQYPCFKYYPQNPDFKDPPYEPSKLFMVQRVKRMKGCPHWEKSILKDFKLDGKLSDIAIVKNTPEINGKLWKIKHLIRIVPITFPNREPNETDGTYLKENGELVVTERLTPIKNRIEASESFENNHKKMDGDTLRRRMRMNWLTAYNPIF